MKNHLFGLIIFFLIYCILGWAIESVYRSFCEKKIINTGFLRGPYCPIYGIGAIAIIILLNSIPILKSNIILLFFTSMIIFTIWEDVVGIALEKIFKTRYWDYSEKKFNIKGRVCLKNSIYWGILGVAVGIFIHPFISNIVYHLYREHVEIFDIVIYIITIIFAIDIYTSIVNIKNVSSILQKVEKINIEIREKMQEITEHEQGSINFEKLSLSIEKLNTRRNKIVSNTYNNILRIKTAFPTIDTKEITQVLNMKMEFAKQKIEKRYRMIKGKVDKFKNNK